MLTNVGFCDVAASLTDPQFQGLYDGERKHEADLPHVLRRAWDQRLKKIIIKGYNQASSLEALALAKTDKRLFSTVGCAPEFVKEFEREGTIDGQFKYMDNIMALVKKNRKKIVAIGEIGLDFEKLDLCEKRLQLRYFIMQIEIAKVLKLPVIIRCRSATEELLPILRSHSDFVSAVLNGFEGDEDEVRIALGLGCHVAVNGCSLKSKEFREVLKTVPTQRVIFSSDAPYCEINPGHHSGAQYMKTVFPTERKKKWTPEKMVRGRTEPANIIQAVEVAAAVRNENPDQLAFLAYRSCKNIFFRSLKKYN